MAEEIAFEQLFEVQPSLLAGVEDVWTKNVKVDHLGEAHTRVIQTYKGIPVWGAEAIVHLRADGSFKAMTDGFERYIQVETTPSLDDWQAIDLAVASRGGWDTVTGTPEADLQIVREDGVDYLTYRVQFSQFEGNIEPAMPVVFVDAIEGGIVNWYNDIKTARNRRTYDANNGLSLPGTFRRGESDGPTGDAVLDEAHDNAGITYNYYSARYGRDSFNDNGATITSTVHYRTNYVNAFWNGSQMVYGDGDGQTSGPLTVLDVVGHELTHAVTDYESDLIYQDESGALNEAMSDIMAAGIEYYANPSATFEDIWWIGEDCWLSEPALRYMNNPTEGGDYDYYPERYTGSEDNGGVHWNSGIANLAFYLLSEGGTHPRDKTTVQVPAIGIEKAEQIFYRANTTYLTASSTFEDARNATASAAADLYGQTEVDAVHLTWDAVGVPGSPNGDPGGDDKYPGLELDQTNLSGSSGTWKDFSLDVPSDATTLDVVMSGGSGDGDLYVRYNALPTLSSYDCRPYKWGNDESCSFSNPAAGTWWISIYGYDSYSGVSLTADYSSN